MGDSNNAKYSKNANSHIFGVRKICHVCFKNTFLQNKTPKRYNVIFMLKTIKYLNNKVAA